MTPGSNFTNWLGVSYNVTGRGADGAQRALPASANLGNGLRQRRERHGHHRWRGNVTATAYDDSDNDVADYTGQALAFNGASVTFENLAPNYQNWYDV